jgi:hypothetical protein
MGSESRRLCFQTNLARGALSVIAVCNLSLGNFADHYIFQNFFFHCVSRRECICGVPRVASHPVVRDWSGEFVLKAPEPSADVISPFHSLTQNMKRSDPQ